MDESWREKIQTSMLINRLTANANGELPTELTTGQLKSIEILLRKSAPDLQAITIIGDSESPLVHRIERVIVDPQNPDSSGLSPAS